MGHEIHKKTRDDGSVIYRLFHTGSDEYEPGQEVDEEGLRMQLLHVHLAKAIQGWSLWTDRQIQEALEVTEWQSEPVQEVDEEGLEDGDEEEAQDGEFMKKLERNQRFAQVAVDAIMAELSKVGS